MSRRLVVLLGLVGLLAACGSGGEGGAPGGDAGSDIVSDVRADVVPDEGPDVSADIPEDVSGADVPPALIDPSLTPEELALPVADELPPPTLPAGIPLEVATYNIYGGNRASLEELATYLAGFELDVLGLQECPSEFVEPIAEATGLTHTVGASGPVLFSRYPLTDTGVLPLGDGRSAAHGVAEIGGASFSLYCVHISWDAAGDRQARELVDVFLAVDPNAHLVMVGDFNDEHYSSQINILEEELADAFTAFGWFPGERISWPATEFGGTEGAQLIDLVFFRRDLPALVLDAEIVNQRPVLSDHKPAVVSLLYPPAGGEPFAQDPFADRRSPWREFPPEAERPANLLTNPGAEDGLAGWDVTGDAMAAAEKGNQLPRSGVAFFTGGEERMYGRGGLATGAQTVDLLAAGATEEQLDAGGIRVYAAGYAQVGWLVDEQGGFVSNVLGLNNHAELTLELLDGDGALLRRVSSGHRDTYAYHPFTAAIDAPPGTRSARLTWLAHQHGWYPGVCDVAFDDLYLGWGEADAPSTAAGGTLVANGGAETGTLDGWQSEPEDGWMALPELELYGFMAFPPWSRSGRSFFYGGGAMKIAAGPEGESRLVQALDLSAHAALQQRGELAVRWGGWVRTWAALTQVDIALEIFDGDGSLWGRVTAPPVHAPEWMPVEQLTRIPPGASAVQLVVSADVSEMGTAVFADELFALPERVAPAGAR